MTGAYISPRPPKRHRRRHPGRWWLFLSLIAGAVAWWVYGISH